jgi:hypothetical protein
VRIVRGIVAWGALGLSLLAPLYFAVAAFGVKFGLLDWRIGYELMTLRIGPFLLVGLALLGALAVSLAFSVTPHRARIAAICAFLVPVAMIGSVIAITRNNVPASTRDVSTDIAEPPAFSPPVRASRATESWPLHLERAVFTAGPYAGRRVVEVQQRIYPDITPVVAAADADGAYDFALATARDLKWRITAEDRAGGRFEARTADFFFGFGDDIVVRVRSNPPGAIVDVRAAARTPSPGFVSVRRVREFIAALKLKMAESVLAEGKPAAPTAQN